MEIIHIKNDILQYYLYKASKTKQFKIRKIIYFYIIPFIFFIMGIYYSYIYSNSKYIQLIVFTVIGILAFIFLPKYLKNSYERHYKSFVKNNLNEIIGKKEIIEINNDKVINKNDISESNVNISSIKYLIEFKDHYIISINDAASLILPKNEESKNIIETIKYKNNLEILNEIKWKW